jgi:PIN domain nuclease of toxin-antitoxin system
MGTKRDIGMSLGDATCLLTATNLHSKESLFRFFNDAAQLIWLFGVEALCDM